MKKVVLVLGTVFLGGLLVTQVFAHGPWRGSGHMMGWGTGAGWGGYGGHMMGYGPGQGYGGPMMGYGPGQGWGGYCWDRFPTEGLTQEQKAKLSELRETFLKETRPLREELVKKQQELWDLRRKEDTQFETLSSKQDEIYAIQKQLQKKEFEFHAEAKKIAPKLYGSLTGTRMGPYAGAGGYCWQ